MFWTPIAADRPIHIDVAISYTAILSAINSKNCRITGKNRLQWEASDEGSAQRGAAELWRRLISVCRRLRHTCVPKVQRDSARALSTHVSPCQLLQLHSGWCCCCSCSRSVYRIARRAARVTAWTSVLDVTFTADRGQRRARWRGGGSQCRACVARTRLSRLVQQSGAATGQDTLSLYKKIRSRVSAAVRHAELGGSVS